MNHAHAHDLFRQYRRTFLKQSGIGIGGLALSSLMQATGKTMAMEEHWSGMVDPMHIDPKAKRVIFLCMAGGPSHLETLDYKPKLA